MAKTFPLRFSSDKQKKDFAKIAKGNNRSINSHILSLIDLDIEMKNASIEYEKTGVQSWFRTRQIPVSTKPVNPKSKR